MEVDKLYCGECGFPNPPQNKFCNKCGGKVNSIDANKTDSNTMEKDSIVLYSTKFQELENKILKLIEHSGYINVLCSEYSIQILKYTSKNKLYIAVLNHDYANEEIQKEIESLDFKFVEANMVRSLNIYSKKKAVKDVMEVVKKVYYQILQIKSNSIFYYEEFYGFDLENGESEFLKGKEITKQEENDHKVNMKIGIFILIVSLIAFGYKYFTNKPNDKPVDKQFHADANVPYNSNTASIGLHNVLKTPFFDVTVNSVEITDAVTTPNEFGDLKKEDGQMYIVLDVTFTNTVDASHMIHNGSVVINYNRKIYNIDNPENMVGAGDGWGLAYDSLNPMTSKTTKVVYKISADIKGDAYYSPGDAGDNQLISLGKIE